MKCKRLISLIVSFEPVISLINSFSLPKLSNSRLKMLRNLLISKCRTLNADQNDRIHERYQMASQTIIGLCAANNENERTKYTKKLRFEEFTKKLNSLSISIDDLNRLEVIHVSGTKGKGSTCAFIASILENYGLKTGFFSSPHLVEIRERIRLAGTPISKEAFCDHFDYVYEKMQTANASSNFPGYFEFLTLMAIRAFIESKVDVAIFEVGIGGELDFTNIVTNVPVCVITALGFDHCNVLGNTIEEIAWQKAGIIKPNSSVITIDSQPPNAIEVIESRAREKYANLDITSNCLMNFETNDENGFLNDRNETLQQNASLAVKAAYKFLKKRHLLSAKKTFDNFLNDRRTQTALRTCKWPGRFQQISCDHIDFFLDGAHTDESIRLCIQWFRSQLNSSKCNKNIPKYLIFNLTRNRSYAEKFSSLAQLDFDLVIFTTNFTCENIANISKDTLMNKKFYDNQLNMCRMYEKYWLSNVNVKTKTIVVTSIEKAIEIVLEQSGEQKTNVLVTGSLILIGNLLSIIKPDLNKIIE